MLLSFQHWYGSPFFKSINGLESYLSILVIVLVSTETFDFVSRSFRQPHILLSLSVAGFFGAGSCKSLSPAWNI